MKRRTVWIGTAMVVAAFAAANASSARVDGVAAYVNQHVITAGDVVRAVAPLRAQMARRYAGDELRQKVGEAFQEALDGLIAQRLVLDAYEKQPNKIPDWVVEERIQAIQQQSFGGDRAELLSALSRDGLTYEEWKEDLRGFIVMGIMRRERVDSLVRVSPADVQKAFETNRDKYRLGDQVRLRMIVLEKGEGEAAAAKRQQADALRETLAAGGDFAAAAKEHSRGLHAEEGGDWGWIEPRMLRPELASVADALQAGDVSAVTEADGELYLLKVEARKAGEMDSPESVRARVERDLRQEASQKAFQAWIDSLKNTSYIEVKDLKPFVDEHVR